MNIVVPKEFTITNSNLSDDEISLITDNLLYTGVDKDVITLSIDVARVDYLVLFGLRADSVSIDIKNNIETIKTSGYTNVKNWLDYFNAIKRYKDKVVIKLPVIIGITQVDITIRGVDGVSLSKVIFGKLQTFGITINQPNVEMVDYSPFDRESGIVEKRYIAKDIKFLEQIENKDDEISAKIDILYHLK